MDNEPYVIEYNCRLGDPETEVVLPRLQNDLVSLFASLYEGTLAQQKIDINPDYATTIMLVSGGYPEAYQKGKVISGLGDIKEGLVFHAGTAQQEGAIVTAGGRVIALTSMASTMQAALALSNHNANQLQFEGKYYRRDIGFDLQ